MNSGHGHLMAGVGETQEGHTLKGLLCPARTPMSVDLLSPYLLVKEIIKCSDKCPADVSEKIHKNIYIVRRTS